MARPSSALARPAAIPAGAAKGTRYPEAQMASLYI